MPPIISFQREIQAEMINQSDKLHVILEHFSFDLQHLLDRYMDGEINFEQLVDKYHITGEEGHNLEPYRELFQDAKNQQGGIHLHAGFLPRKYARMLMRGITNITMYFINISMYVINITMYLYHKLRYYSHK